MVLTAVAFTALVLRPARQGDQAPGDDPWDAQTLEWTTTSPAPRDNYTEVPTVMSPEPVLDRRGPDGADR
jgi:heme/copper-type cytochrome/quinol oxidase subunit 1